MSPRLDLLIFGATGFTGMHVIPVVHKLSKANGRSLTWGVSGRSEDKLKEVMEKIGKEKGIDLSAIPLVIADINDEASLKTMTEKTKVVINCCGPYRFLGDAVVKACIANGTHHVDVSGEPQFMERVQLEQNQAATQRGVYIVSACGLDSIPTDMGIVFLREKFEGQLNSVATYLEGWEEKGESEVSGPSVNYGTWESAVYGLAHADELRELRRKLFPTRLPKFTPTLEQKKLPHKSDLVQGWVVPFLGSDRSVARRSQRFFYENESTRPIQIETYLVLKSLWYLLIASIFGGVFLVLSKFDFGRKLLLKYPHIFSGGVFSKETPSEEKINRTWFRITFYGEGWKDKLSGPDDVYNTPVDRKIVAQVKGQNPGYGATCIALVVAAIMIVTESDKMPGSGGVYPPGAAFAKTSMIKELNENGVVFEVLSQNDI